MSDTTGSQSDDDATKGTGGSNDSSSDDKSTQGTSQTSNDTSSNDDGGDDKGKGSSDTVTREEFDKLYARMTAADRAKSEAEERAKALEREKMSENEKVAAELKDVTAERDSLRERLKDTRIENAFLSYNKHTWHDPQDALRLLDMSGVEISEDGKVSGLDAAIDKLAKDKTHLVKSDEDKDGKGSSAASGSAKNGTRKGDKKEPPKNYSSRFPALRNSGANNSNN